MGYKRAMSVFMAGIMVVSIFPGMGMMDVKGINGSFGGGDGTAGNPYLIEDVLDLQNMSNNLTAYYVLKNDIDASATKGWNGGAGFNPVGNRTVAFNGTLDGKGHNITGLFVARAGTDYVGLFGYLGNNGSVSNVSILNGNVTGKKNTGGLAGYSNGTVNNSCFIGNLTGRGYNAGGLVGYNCKGTVNNSYAIGEVTGSDDFLGGLVGYNYYGNVNNSGTAGNVTRSGSSALSIGGLIGVNFYGMVANSFAWKNVTAIGDYFGGLVGYNDHGTVSGSYACGNVSGWNQIGGLLGFNYYGTVNGSYAEGNVSGIRNVGGLFGENRDGTVSNSHYDIDKMSIMGGYHVTTGGIFDAQYQDWLSKGRSLNISDYSSVLVPSGQYYNVTGIQGLRDLLGFADAPGYRFRLAGDIDLSGAPGLFIPYIAAEFDGANHTILNPRINQSFASGIGMFGFNNGGTIRNTNVIGGEVNGYCYIGLLAGSNAGLVDNTYAAGNVNSTGDSIGGFVGRNTGTVNGSRAAGNVIGSGDYIGGLLGFNGGGVNNSSASVNINGYGSYAGGLSGGNSGTINGSSASGNVSGTKYIGGLVGRDDGTINSSCASGNVTGTSDYVGGLVGYIYFGTVSFSFATGNVNGTTYHFGGLVGYNRGTVNRTYATGKVKGTTNVGGLVGYNDGTVNQSYSTGNVTGTGSYIGGLVGYNYGNVYNSFWDNETSGRNTSQLGTRKTTAEMKTRSTFNSAGWNFTDTWCMIENVTYPLFRWQDRQYPSANAGPDQTIDEDILFMFNGSGNTDDVAIANYTWNFTDGSPVTLFGVQPTYRFDNPGQFIVTLNVTDIVGNRNSDTMTLTVRDITPPVAYAGQDMVVEKGTVVTFNGTLSFDNVGIVNYTWNFTDAIGVTLYGVQPQHQFNAYGQFIVTLNVTDAAGNWRTDTMTVTVKDITPPSADAGPDQNVNEDVLVAFNGSGSSDNIGIVNYTWNFTDGALVMLYGLQPTYTFNMPGIFVVTLRVTDAEGNWATDNVTVTVRDITPPSADAGPDQVVDEDSLMAFNGSGSFDNAGIDNYTWNFTDGAPVRLYGAKPSYTFKNPGFFIVMLKVTDAAGNWATDMMTVTVNDITAPAADAGPNQTIDEGTLVIFNGSGSWDNVGIVNYTWTFMDGAPVALYLVQPTYRFMNPGVFVVTLNATDAAGNWNTDTMKVTVNDITAPVADAGPDQVVDEGTLVIFNASECSDNVGIINYTWSFVDKVPVILYGAKPSYLFDNPGVFVVTLNVSDAAGNRDTDALNITVNDITAPIAEAGPDMAVDEGTVVTFNGSGSSDNVRIVNCTWAFDDGGIIRIYGIISTFKFDNPGSLVVTLNITDETGRWATDLLNLTVNDITRPSANAGQDRTVDEGTVLSFDGSGSSDNVGIFNYSWKFTDGGLIILYGARPTYTFSNPGIFVVTLNVTDTAGNWHTDTMTVIVKDITAPIANTGPNQTIDEGTEMVFNASGSLDNVGIVNYTWTLLDGAPVALFGIQPSYKFDVPGIFVVTLNISDAAGNWGLATMKIIVKDITPPVADAGRDQEVPVGTTIILNASGSSDNVGIEMYFWNFTYYGKKQSLGGAITNFIFIKGGVFNIILTVIDGAGNFNEDYVNITVVDTGTVTGTVVDKNGKPVGGAIIKISASNGMIGTSITPANGTFSIEVSQGSFTWNISKKGYHKISGNFSVDAMKEARLDLSNHPLKKEEKKGSPGVSLIPVVLIGIVIVAFVAGGYVFMKRKKIPPKVHE
jgi:hypothetical protein